MLNVGTQNTTKQFWQQINTVDLGYQKKITPDS